MLKYRKLDLKNKREQKAFLDLMKLSLTARDKDWLEWKYLKNPYVKNEEPGIYCCVDSANDRIVGIRPLLDMAIRYKKRTFKIQQPCDTIVHPEYRGKGIFTEMNHHAIHNASKDNIAFFMNFPNSNSMPGYLKMGWKKISLFNDSFLFNNFTEVVRNKSARKIAGIFSKVFAFKFNKLKHFLKKTDIFKKKNKQFKIRELNDVSDEMTDLWENQNKDRFYTTKNRDYLNWRYLQRPDKKYQIWACRNEKHIESYMVTTVSNRWSCGELQIVDYQFRTIVSFFFLLNQILDVFKNKNIAFINILIFTESELFLKMNNFGFFNRNDELFKKFMPQNYFVLKQISEDLPEEINHSEKWNLRLIDRDTY